MILAQSHLDDFLRDLHRNEIVLRVLRVPQSTTEPKPTDPDVVRGIICDDGGVKF